MIGRRSPDAIRVSSHRTDPLSRIGAACAVLYTAALIVAFLMLAAIGLLDAVNATESLPILARHRTTALIAGWLFFVGPVLLALAGLGALGTFRQAGSLVWVAAFTFIGGSLMALIRNIIWLAMTFELAPTRGTRCQSASASC